VKCFVGATCCLLAKVVLCTSSRFLLSFLLDFLLACLLLCYTKILRSAHLIYPEAESSRSLQGLVTPAQAKASPVKGAKVGRHTAITWLHIYLSYCFSNRKDQLLYKHIYIFYTKQKVLYLNVNFLNLFLYLLFSLVNLHIINFNVLYSISFNYFHNIYEIIKMKTKKLS
jgi:hypothetical protein